jgi:hypothetical protein
MAKGSIFPDLSEQSRCEMEKQMLAETGIDFSLYRTEELGAQIGDMLGIFSWIALILKTAVLVIPATTLFFIYIISPSFTPLDSAGDIVLLLVALLWLLLSNAVLGVTNSLRFAMKKVSGTSADLLSLMLELLEKSAGAVKECTPDMLVRLVTTNGALVVFPLISSAVVANLALGKIRIPGTKFIAEKVGTVVAIKLSMTIIDKLGFSQKSKKESVQLAPDALVDALSLVESLSFKANDLNKKLRGRIVKPFAILNDIAIACTFIPPLLFCL